MFVYEFLVPSDTITFKAENDKIAYMCAVLLGEGKAQCIKHDAGQETSLGTLFLFECGVDEKIVEYIGGDVNDFISANKDKIKEGLSSFMYVSPEEREDYDNELEAIEGDEAKEAFKKSKENELRTSLSLWVLKAWHYAKKNG